ASTDSRAAASSSTTNTVALGSIASSPEASFVAAPPILTMPCGKPQTDSRRPRLLGDFGPLAPKGCSHRGFCNAAHDLHRSDSGGEDEPHLAALELLISMHRRQKLVLIEALESGRQPEIGQQRGLHRRHVS